MSSAAVLYVRGDGHLSETLALALQVRAQMTKKLEAAALSGKGIDVDKRGQFNDVLTLP